MTDEELLELFSEAFPDYGLWVGARLNKRQGEVVRIIARELSQRKKLAEILMTSMAL